jgi:hypothetical protein
LAQAKIGAKLPLMLDEKWDVEPMDSAFVVVGLLALLDEIVLLTLPDHPVQI